MIDNQLAAQLLYSHRLATREQIMECWSQISPAKDIGALLVDRGILSQDTYRGLMAFMETQAAPVQTAEPTRPEAHTRPEAESRRRAAAPDPSWSPAQPAPAPSPDKVPAASPGKAPAAKGLTAPAAPAATAAPTAPGTPIAPPASAQAPAAVKGPAAAPAAVGPDSAWQELLAFARQQDASDLHLTTGNPPLIRRYGQLRPVHAEPLAPETVRRWVETALDAAQLAEFDGKGDLEFVYELEGWGRYRITFLRQRQGCDITVRMVPSRVRTFEETGLPESCRELTQWAQGMVLVTGPVGCGKSSTLAALVDLVNQDRHDHIITLEDPIEMIYPPAKCRITQRQVGRDTKSQDTALRAALREDPDIIVIAELRDLETIRLAVSAAETGHLVFGTMNTASAARTLFRLVDSFPPEEQGVVRNMISESLRGVISQQLVPLLDGSGSVPAFEVLLVTSAVANMIRKEETHQLGTAMLTGKSQGMVILDESLKALVEKGLVDPREAQARATNPKDFDRYVRASAPGGR